METLKDWILASLQEILDDAIKPDLYGSEQSAVTQTTSEEQAPLW